MPVPTGRLVVLAVAVSIAVGQLPLSTLPALLVVNAIVIVIGVVDSRTAPAPDSLGVERIFPDVVPLGREAEVAWRVTNPTASPLRVAIADELAPSLRARASSIAVTIPPNASTTATTSIRPSRRGRFALDTIAVRVTGRSGLGARQRRIHAPATLRVYPSFASRDEAELRINRARILEVGLRSAQGRGGGTDFDSLRDYGPDDEFRRIDWAATARAGKAIVRTYRAERNQSLLLLLDTGRVMAGRIADVPRLEHAMDAVMMLTTVATRLGDRAGLVAFDAEVHAVLAPSHSRGQVGRVTESMYELEPRLVESDYTLAFTTALSRFRRRAMLVVLTDLAEQTIQETLLPALPLVVRDHIVVVASVQDPDVASWSRAMPADAESAYRRAAAIATLEERRRVAMQLRGLGVTVVDAPPGKLATELADAYLRVKATGRL